MRYLKERYAFDALQFADDHFFVDREWAFSVMKELHSLGIVFNTICARVQDLDQDFFETLMRYGCRAVLVGFESDNPRVLKLMHKEATPEALERALELAAHYPEIQIYSLIILGVPTHTWQEMTQTIRHTVELLERYPNFECSMVGYTPIAGSGFYPMVTDKGFSGYNHMRDFSIMGWGKKYDYEYVFDMEWLDITPGQKRTIKQIPRLAYFYNQTRTLRRLSHGPVWIVNEIFYQMARWRLTRSNTACLYEDRLYAFITDISRLLIKRGLIAMPQGQAR